MIYYVSIFYEGKNIGEIILGNMNERVFEIFSSHHPTTGQENLKRILR